MLKRRTLRKDLSVTPTEFVGAFPKKGVSIIASKPGVGKTWYVLYNIISLSRQGFKTCTFFGDCPPNVVYDRINNLEDSGEDIPEEMKQMYFLTDAVREKQQMFLTVPEGLHNFCEVLHYERPDVVFIDTFSSLTDIEESSQKDTAELFQKLIVIAEKYNCAIVIIHHLRKSSRKERAMSVDLDDIIGSSIITRLASLVVVLTKDRETGRVYINVVKTWYQEQEIPTMFKVTTEDSGYVKIRISNTHAGVKPSSGSKAMILDFIARFYEKRGEHGNTFVIDNVVAELGISHTLARNTLNAMAKEEKPYISVQCVGNRRFYTIIDKNYSDHYNTVIINQGGTPNGSSDNPINEQVHSQAE